MGRVKQSYSHPRKPHQKFNGHTDLVRGVLHLPGGQRILTCSGDGSLQVWNSEDGSPIGKAWYDGKSPVNTIALSPDGKTVACGSDDGAVRLWDIDKGSVVAKWTGHRDRVLSTCWSQDGQRVVSGSADGTARVWDMKSGKTTLGLIDTKHETVYAVAFSRDDTMVATGGSGSGDYIKIWNVRTFKLITTLAGHEWTVRCLAWTEDGKTLISGSADCSIRTWSTTTWRQLTVLAANDEDVDYPIIAIAISPNQRILASASLSFTAELWDIENSQRIGSPLLHGTNAAHRMSFSEDGNLLATCSENNAYTWDVSEIVKEAGFDHLLLPIQLTTTSIEAKDPARKTVPDAASKLINNTPRLPQGFFDDKGGHIHASSAQSHVGSSACQPSSRPRALGALTSLFRRSHSTFHEGASHDTPTPFRSLMSTLVGFSRDHRSDSKQRPPEADVSHADLRNRNVHPVQPPNKTLPHNNFITLNIPNVPRTGDTVRQSNESVYSQQPSLQPQESPAITHVQAVTKTTPAEIPSTPDAAKRQAGRWSRLWHYLCCNSSEDAVDRY